MPLTITDELIDILRRMQAKGVNTAWLSESTRQLLLEPRPRPKKPAANPLDRVPPQEDVPNIREMPIPPQPSPQPEQHAPTTPTHVDQDTTPIASLDWKRLQDRVARCRLCPLHQGRTQAVFGDGDPQARLMFIGEGPGRDEDIQGIPFVGRAGQLLTRMIEAMQFARSEVYIANIVKCRPPNNRNPEDAEADACMPYLKRQIALVKPEVIVLLGAVPLKHLLGESGINRLHGQWREIDGIPTMPTFHPAYLLRVASRKRDAWEDLQKVMVKLGKDPTKTQNQRKD